MTLWSGRVATRLAPEVWAFLRAQDDELLAYDCAATVLHAERLRAAGVLTDVEYLDAKAQLEALPERGTALLGESEDVHSAIEHALGEVGRKIHTGRSRNDQVAAAMRLYVEDACGEAADAIRAFALAILDLAEAEADTLMPGYTHLQRAQPVTLGHHLLAWVEMLGRDLKRFAFAAERASESPLGAGALAGSTLPLPSPPRAMRNSIDAVSDRDFALDYLYACALLFVHLSRIGEELVLWTSAEFGFVKLGEESATGSSMMPQKLNPDAAELARGKAGTAIGRLAGLLATVKSLPLAYDRDLQEDKRPVFDARRDLREALAALRVLVAAVDVQRGRLAEAAADPALLATDEAERLVARGVAFRDAHAQVARAVREGTFAPAGDAAASVAARLGDVRAAAAAARARFAQDT